MNNSSLYLDLLERVLTRTGFEEGRDLAREPTWLPPEIRRQPKRRLLRAVGRLAASRGFRLLDMRPVEDRIRDLGLDWPTDAETMVGRMRLHHLRNCVEEVLRRDVPGDLIETGVWRGGASILMKGVLAAAGNDTRRVYVADSFRGLPAPNPRYAADAGFDLHEFDELAVGVQAVRANFERYGLLDDNVKFLVGWFTETLPTAPMEKLAVLRLDGDMYESTMTALTHLYPKLQGGGYCIIDDYIIGACREAVNDYREGQGIGEVITDIDGTGAFWQKEG